ncbi:MAG: CoA transferase [Sphingomonadales bacterium]|nr:CoA transferase [Sphingomonadales bacterium]
MIERLHRILERRLDGFGLSPRELLVRDAPGGLQRPGLVSANGHCRLQQTSDGWVAINLARSEDIELIPALTGGKGETWDALTRFALAHDAISIRDRAIELQLPVAIPGESAAYVLDEAAPGTAPRRVVDLSALWAGPLCAGLLARVGASVVRIESIGRPDPTPRVSPELDARINGEKTTLALDLREAGDRDRLYDEISKADVLVTSARAAALARLGLAPDKFSRLTWVAITAHGFSGAGAHRVGFGDDCAIAGGLMGGSLAQPRFVGNALADPLTGLEAARAVLAGRCGVIDMAMARVAAGYAQAVAS